MARDQRGLAAIVSADVAGYSRLMGRDDSATLAALKAHRRELIDPKITKYGGRIVKTTGDGLRTIREVEDAGHRKTLLLGASGHTPRRHECRCGFDVYGRPCTRRRRRCELLAAGALR